MGFTLETGVAAAAVFLQGILSFFSPCVLPLVRVRGGLPLHGGRGRRPPALSAEAERHARVGHFGRRRGRWRHLSRLHRRSWR